ncbi:MAG: hypothetical protein ABW086_01975 [Sedimenticola sp.]
MHKLIITLLVLYSASTSVISGQNPHPQEDLLELEPCLNGEVSASGMFPNQKMEDQFIAYLKWVDQQGLPRSYAFSHSGTRLLNH